MVGCKTVSEHLVPKGDKAGIVVALEESMSEGVLAYRGRKKLLFKYLECKSAFERELKSVYGNKFFMNDKILFLKSGVHSFGSLIEVMEEMSIVEQV